MKKTLFITLTFFSFSMLAQKYEQRGQVIENQNNEPIVGASVVVSESVYTITDADGNFLLKTEKEQVTARIQALGFQTQQVQLKAGEPMTIVLNENIEQLQDVVVTALGIKRDKEELGYSVSELNSKELTDVPQTNVVNSLAGTVAGVQITNGSSGIGSSSRIVIRGESSLSNTNQPLFVVDGIPINNELIASDLENTEQGIQEVDWGNGASEIHPDDIESISVLKGPGAAALYGARAGNGVVVINTKKGTDKGGFGITTSSYYTFETPLRIPDYQNVYGGGAGGEFAYDDGLDAGPGEGKNDGGIRSFGPQMNGQLITQFDGMSTDANGNPVRGGDIIARNVNGTLNPITPTAWEARPDNVRNFFQTGTTYQTNLAISKANEKSSFRLSYSALDNTGILPNTDLNRQGISLSAEQKFPMNVRANIFANYIHSESSNRPGLGYGSENVMYIFNWMGRQNNVENLRDYWQAGQEGLEQFNFNYQWMDNPYLTLFENTNAFDKNRLIGNGALTWDATEKLSLRFRTGIDYFNELRTFRRAFSSQRWAFGAYREDDISFKEINTDLLATYRDRIGESDWSYTASVGANQMNQEIGNKATQAGELSVPNVYNFENSRIPLVISQFPTKKRINSLYGLAQFNYKSGFFFDVTVRNDWFSTLPIENASIPYYSASVSYVLNRFFDLPDAINYAKLRFSSASVGNDTDPYQTEQTFRFNQNYGSNPLVTNRSTLVNSDFQPERLNALELGGEFWFFGNRLMLDATVNQNISVNQIIGLPNSAASGFTNRVVNGGTVRSRGLELLVQGTIIEKDNFRWTATATYAANRAEVTELPDGVDQYVLGVSQIYSGGGNQVFYIVKEGGRVGDMYGTGILQHEGRDVYNQNGIPLRDGELQLLGNYNPDFIVGLNNQFKYKNVSLNILWDWRQGGTIVSRTKSLGLSSGVLEESLEGRENGIVGDGVVNIGTMENPNYVENTTAISAVDYYNQYNNRGNEATALYDASYLKLRQVSLYFTLPQKWSKAVGSRKIQFGVIGSNLLLFTENPHFDPELSAMQGRNFAYGVDDMSYPSSRSYGFALKTQF